MRLRARLTKDYGELKSDYLRSLGFEVPERYASSFVHWGGGADSQYIYLKLLAGVPVGSKVLIVGVMGGRDYFLLANVGYDVTAFDVGPQPDIPDIVYGNVENPLPFPQESFDAVILGEVLEHLAFDVDALRNLRTVLKHDGRLLVTVPFYQDIEEGHMRIHSPASVQRLLTMGGFRTLDYVERPILFRPGRISLVAHAASLVSFRLRRRTLYRASNRFVGELSWRLGHMLIFGRFRRLTQAYGGYFLCAKGDVLDHVSLNRHLYTRAGDE